METTLKQGGGMELAEINIEIHPLIGKSVNESEKRSNLQQYCK